MAERNLEFILTFLIKNNKADLTVKQLSVLLYCLKEKQTVRGLANVINTHKPAITRAVQKLEALGFVMKKVDKDDRRSVFISLTPSGKKLIQSIS